MSMSMPISGSADDPHTGVVDDDFFGGNPDYNATKVAPTVAPSAEPAPTIIVLDGDDDDTTIPGDGGTTGDGTVPTFAPSSTGMNITDPNESTIPNDAFQPSTASSGRRAGVSGMGLAWIGIAAVVVAVVGGVWWAKNRHKGVGGAMLIGGKGTGGDSSGSSSMSSTSRLAEV